MGEEGLKGRVIRRTSIGGGLVFSEHEILSEASLRRCCVDRWGVGAPQWSQWDQVLFLHVTKAVGTLPPSTLSTQMGLTEP